MRQKFKLITALLIGPLITTSVHSKSDVHSHHQHMLDHQSASNWTDAPLLVLAKKRTRGFKSITLKGLHTDEVTVIPSDAEERWPVAVKDKVVKVKSRGGRQGGYHWLGTTSEQENYVQSVASVIYFPNPGPAPRPMLSLQKSTLDISPVKLPREHQHFRAGENWDFLVRLNDKPLKNVPVVLETENKTRQVLTTNHDGLVSITFPYDFSDEPETVDEHSHDHQRRKKAGFVLTVKQDLEGRQFISHFNYHYTTGAFYNKNLALGIGFALFGMITAVPLLRKPRKGDKA